VKIYFSNELFQWHNTIDIGSETEQVSIMELWLPSGKQI